MSLQQGPLYQQIREAIRRSILSGEIKPHERVGSEHELAEKYKVSRVTTRQALNELEQDGIIYRIQGKGSYVAEAKETSSDKDLPLSIGVLVPFIHDNYTMRMVEGIERQARQLGFNTILLSSDNKIKQESELIKQVRKQGVAGFIIWMADSRTYNESILRLKMDGFPFVLVDRYMEHVPTDYVISDNISGGYAATRHLLELGHRKIGFVTPPMDSALTNRLRLEGYKNALAESGIRFRISNLHEVDSMEGYQDRLRTYLKEQKPTAVFAANDIVAMMVLKAAFEEGIQCPLQLSVVGFDNLAAVSHLQVPLTSVDQHVQDIGRIAVEIIVSKINGEQTEHSQVVVPTQLVVRESCVPYDKAHDLNEEFVSNSILDKGGGG